MLIAIQETTVTYYQKHEQGVAIKIHLPPEQNRDFTDSVVSESRVERPDLFNFLPRYVCLRCGLKKAR